MDGQIKEYATECIYKEIDKRLKEEFINLINGQTITTKIFRELTVIKNTSEIAREQVLS